MPSRREGSTDGINAHLPYLLPWIKLQLVIRQMRSTTWDSRTRPIIKTELLKAYRRSP